MYSLEKLKKCIERFQRDRLVQCNMSNTNSLLLHDVHFAYSSHSLESTFIIKEACLQMSCS